MTTNSAWCACAHHAKAPGSESCGYCLEDRVVDLEEALREIANLKNVSDTPEDLCNDAERIAVEALGGK